MYDTRNLAILKFFSYDFLGKQHSFCNLTHRSCNYNLQAISDRFNMLDE